MNIGTLYAILKESVIETGIKYKIIEGMTKKERKLEAERLEKKKALMDKADKIYEQISDILKNFYRDKSVSHAIPSIKLGLDEFRTLLYCDYVITPTTMLTSCTSITYINTLHGCAKLEMSEEPGIHLA